MRSSEIDRCYMRRCLQLAEAGRGYVSPNPMVGAVIVCDGRIIGEGYHRRYGEAHAEVNAVASVGNETLLSRSTLYVSLEPCSHYGKTPPCSKLIIDKKIPRVVVGCLDPFPEVSGRGVAMLREAGVEVITGVLEAECREQNRAFMTAHATRRPYVVLKWAQSRDGFIDRRRTPDEEPQKFSDELTRQWAHKLRAECDAIMVGAGTAMFDNPSLSLRHWPGRRSPMRVLVAGNLDRLVHTRLLADDRPTLLFVPDTAVVPSVSPGVEVIAIDYTAQVLPQILENLYIKGVTSLLVEGGAYTSQQFIDSGLWNEAHVETAPIELTEGVAAPILRGYTSSKRRKFGEREIATYFHR
ncbi:MAG: bifunctional diaminohydroxyphosphoribosylaminopyrimidine deaminase/5-amino-6-(5-phosphoribosylamino)uracil reductase RibD [Coprobacter sp.]|nr:bifunctional diaminohydroxyphosphoribosylaminopyrimidine deaminase/5-amino-6-(5-phosphoribosylamino)uracil reductase RibD [Coprobacter sp.]